MFPGDLQVREDEVGLAAPADHQVGGFNLMLVAGPGPFYDEEVEGFAQGEAELLLLGGGVLPHLGGVVFTDVPLHEGVLNLEDVGALGTPKLYGGLHLETVLVETVLGVTLRAHYQHLRAPWAKTIRPVPARRAPRRGRFPLERASSRQREAKGGENNLPEPSLLRSTLSPFRL